MLCSSHCILSFESLLLATRNLFNSVSSTFLLCFVTPSDGREQTLVSWYIVFYVLALERPIHFIWFRKEGIYSSVVSVIFSFPSHFDLSSWDIKLLTFELKDYIQTKLSYTSVCKTRQISNWLIICR